VDGTSGLATAQDALADGRWADARQGFEAALAEGETAVAHAGLGEATWWLCDFDASVRARERAFVLFRREGESARAGRLAIDLCISYLVNLENVAAALGWLARAERVLDEQDSASLRGWLSLMRGFMSDTPEKAGESFDDAITQGRASGDVDLELVGLGDLGLSLVRAGRVGDGIAMLDEAMAATLGGECHRRDTVVWTSCSMLEACSLCGDLDRARQWCRAADRFMEQFGCPFLNARCRAHYGSVLVRSGDWPAAERELQAALELSQLAGRAPRDEALASLADLRVRQGRVEDARALLALVDDRRLTAMPRATLALVTGDGASAVSLLEDRLALCGDEDVESAPLLALLVQSYLVQGRVERAEQVQTRLQVADHAPGSAAGALCTLTAARLAAARGDVRRAQRLFEEAVDELRRRGAVRDEDLVVLTIGEPLAKPGGTNTMKILSVGDVR